jgi:hypothetical protein
VVNFAVEYEEKKEDEEVFFDELPPLKGNNWDEEDYDQDELDEMMEWKGPGGFPGAKKNLPNQGLNVLKNYKVPKKNIPGPPVNNMVFNKKQANVKVNAHGHRSTGNTNKPPQNNKNNIKTLGSIPDPVLKINKKQKGHQHTAKCKLIHVPMGYDGDHVEEVILKRKLTIEDYSSDKEIAVKVGNPHNVDKEEEVENFVGGMMDFKKKKQNSNNMYMKQGVNRDNYIQNDTRNRQFSKERPVEVKSGRSKNQISPRPNTKKPYLIPKKGSNYSKSPRNKAKPYQKYNAPNQINMKSTPPQTQNNKVDLGNDKIKDARSKQLLEMDDFSMPYNAINCLTKRVVKVQGNQRIKTVRKIFTMRDGTQEVHENNFVERI